MKTYKLEIDRLTLTEKIVLSLGLVAIIGAPIVMTIIYGLPQN